VKDHYNLSELVRRTGAKRRAVQLWADGGVLEGTHSTNRAGTGVHRQFPTAEVQIAALIVPLANMGVPIGILKQFAAAVRPTITVAPWVSTETYEKSTLDNVTKGLGIAFKRATDGAGQNFLLFSYHADNAWIGAVSDLNGRVCINPRDDLKAFPAQSREAVVILDLTDLLGSLFDR
jgi:hypothetical protein